MHILISVIERNDGMYERWREETKIYFCEFAQDSRIIRSVFCRDKFFVARVTQEVLWE